MKWEWHAVRSEVAMVGHGRASLPRTWEARATIDNASNGPTLYELGPRVFEHDRRFFARTFRMGMAVSMKVTVTSAGLANGFTVLEHAQQEAERLYTLIGERFPEVTG